MERYILIILIFFASCRDKSFSVEDNVLRDGHLQSIAILKGASYFTSYEKIDVKQANSRLDSSQNFITDDQISFGTGEEEVWIKIQIQNRSKEDRWIFVSEYPWLDRIEIYVEFEDKITFQGEIGQLSESPRIHSKNSAIWITTPPNKTFFLILHVSSWADKLLSINLESSDFFLSRDQIPFSFFPAFTQFVLLILVVCTVYWIRSKNNTALYYIILIVQIVIYFSFIEGYAQFYLPKNRWNSHIMFTWGYLCILNTLAFGQSFLSLSIRFPIINRLIQILAWIVLFGTVLIWVPGTPAILLENGGKIVYLTSVLFLTIAGILAIKSGYKLAFFSTGGIICSFVGINIFEFSGIFGIPANHFTQNSPYIGYLAEFTLFFIGLTRKSSGTSNHNDVPTVPDRKKTISNRLKSVSIDKVREKLIRLMEEERIFCDEDLGVERLASMLSLTRHQLSDFLKIVYHQSFYEYITEIRILEFQKILLEEPKRSITSITNSVGFNSRSKVYTEFKKRFAMTPEEFRKQHLSM